MNKYVKLNLDDSGMLAQSVMGNYAMDWRILIANDLIHHLAIVAAQPDGEDSAGRQKLRLLTPDEVAQRALDIADELFARGVLAGYFYRIDTE